MKDYEKSSKTLYRVVAKVYDLMDLLIFPKEKANPRKALAERIPNEKIRVLDVCCGTGNSTFAIGKRNPCNIITGIDISNDMLRVARSKAEKYISQNTNFVEMNAADLGFSKDSFDVVTISLAFHEMPEALVASILTEMNRVLKNNGKLYIIDWDKPQSTIASMFFEIFPTLFEPKGFRSFLKINWTSRLKEFGFTLKSNQNYSFTKLIEAIKQ